MNLCNNYRCIYIESVTFGRLCSPFVLQIQNFFHFNFHLFKSPSSRKMPSLRSLTHSSRCKWHKFLDQKETPITPNGQVVCPDSSFFTLFSISLFSGLAPLLQLSSVYDCQMTLQTILEIHRSSHVSTNRLNLGSRILIAKSSRGLPSQTSIRGSRASISL